MRQLIYLGLMLVCSGCATNLLKKSDYQYTRLLLNSGDYKDALDSLPKENSQKGFITNTERGWLQLLSGEATPNSLLRTSKKIQEKETVSISEEASQYFYVETEDGYIPAEHEIIWLHVLTGFHFARAGQLEQSRVEVAKATELLQNNRSSGKSNFDDAGIRLLLAGLWMANGEWEHAKVDLRRAFELDPKLKWAKDLASKNSLPEKFHILFRGAGPEPRWVSPPSLNSSHYLDGVEFSNQTLSETDSYLVNTENQKITPISKVSTYPWYVRHKDRNNAIRDILVKSKYMVASGVTEFSAATDSLLNEFDLGASFVVATLVGVASVAASIGILASIPPASSTDGVMTLAGAIAYGGVSFAAQIFNAAQERNRERALAIEKMKQDPGRVAESFRFVRFLPDTISAISSTKERHQVQLNDKTLMPFLKMENPKFKNQVFLYFDPL